jgi:hypothetical protein
MVQLTLLPAESPTALSREIASVSRRWESGTADGHRLAEARRVTAARFSAWGSRELSSRERERIGAYFRAVCLRRIHGASDPAAVRIRRRLVATSIAADLREGGWDARRAAEEARRITGEDCFPAGAA